MFRIVSRITIIMLLAGIVSVATYFAVPQSWGPDRIRGEEPEGIALADLDSSSQQHAGDIGAFPAGERPGHHGEFSVVGGLLGIVKNGSLFAVAMLGAIGIRRLRGRRVVRVS